VEIVINLIETPQRADFKAEYTTNDDILTVKIGETTEVFDFTGLAEGKAEEITVEILPINPIVSAEKTDETINITVIRFYGVDEKELFENGENQMEK
jgi:hypothetical protein